jgi:hypothetical protein
VALLPANVRVGSNVDIAHEQPAFVAALYRLAAAFPRYVFDVFSGYRGPGTTGQRSAAVGGFTGDPHERGIAADINVGGRPIGQVFSQSTLARFGLMSGNVANFYQGKPDPSHLQLSAGNQLGKPATSAITQGSFVDAVLHAIGAPLSATNRALLSAWAQTEGTRARFNPLATTQDAAGATVLAGNSAGVKNYPSFQAGVRATAQTLENGRYAGILSSLRAGNVQPLDVVNRYAKEFDTWGTGATSLARTLGQGGSHGGWWNQLTGGFTAVIQSPYDPLSHLPGFGGANPIAWAEGLGKLLGNLNEPHFWLRVLELVAGGVLILVGLYMLAQKIGLAPDAKKVAGGPLSAAVAAA